MKNIDIHTKKELYENESRYSKSIDSEKLKNHVYDQITFELTDNQWSLIDVSFSEIWNNKIGIGGYFYWDEIATYIYYEFVKHKQLVSKDKIESITELMLSKIENDGGFME